MNVYVIILHMEDYFYVLLVLSAFSISFSPICAFILLPASLFSLALFHPVSFYQCNDIYLLSLRLLWVRCPAHLRFLTLTAFNFSCWPPAQAFEYPDYDLGSSFDALK